MITGTHPFKSDDKYTVLENANRKAVNLAPVINMGCTIELQNFVLRLLEKDVTKRPSSEEALKDPWFTKFELGEEKKERLQRIIQERLNENNDNEGGDNNDNEEN